MNQSTSTSAAERATMPLEAEIRASARRSMALRRGLEQVTRWMQEPVVSESQALDRLNALQGLRSTLSMSPDLFGKAPEAVAPAGKSRRLRSLKLI